MDSFEFPSANGLINTSIKPPLVGRRSPGNCGRAAATAAAAVVVVAAVAGGVEGGGVWRVGLREVVRDHHRTPPAV